MRRALALTLSVGLGLHFSAAEAQNLDAYKAMAQALDAAAQSSGHNALKTLSHLDTAQQALGQLAPTLGNPQIMSGLSDTLSAVRAAQSRTPAELQAQVLLARGLMRKALYDQTVADLATAPGSSAEGLRLLAAELGVDPQSVVADAKAGRVNVVTWRLQKAAAAKVGAALAQAEAKQSAGQYLNLARASSWFTVVQDTSQTLSPQLEAHQFQEALTQLAAGDIPALRRNLTALKSEVRTLNSGLAVMPGTQQPKAKASNTAVNGSLTKPKPHSVAAPHSTQAAGGAHSQQRAAGASAVSLTSLNSAYTALGRALTATGHSDMMTARQQLAALPGLLATAPVSVRQGAGYALFINHAQALAHRQGLRPADVQALTAELSGLEKSVPRQAPSVLDALSGSVSRFYGGGLRALLGLVLAAACLLPLYLLNLAFGGRNPYWRAISAALGLLLLPTILEGVFGFLGWVGDLTGVPILRSLTNLTLTQGAYGAAIRTLLTLVAVVLATHGFRGLCLQFGLLGDHKKPVRAAAPLGPTNTSFDWDEEL